VTSQPSAVILPKTTTVITVHCTSVSDTADYYASPFLRWQLEEAARRYGFPLEIVGLGSREAIFEELGRDFERELLEYALLPSTDGPGWGCNVNLSFLKTAGRLLATWPALHERAVAENESS